MIPASVGLGAGPRPGEKLKTLRALPYRLPLRRPWRSARGLIHERRGWLVVAESKGRHGFGDCAPLVEAGTESAVEAGRSLRHWQRRLPGLPIDTALDLVTAGPPAAPAPRYAVECALLDLESRLAGVPMRRWILGPDAGPAPGPGPAPDPAPDRALGSIGVNAILGPITEVSEASLGWAIDSGFAILKVKVGCGEAEAEIARLADLAPRLPPGVRFRLDANGAWDRGTAEWVIAALNGLPVESLEEPLAHPDPAELVRLQAIAAFPLALDESLPRWARGPEQVPYPLRRAVIKPAVIGGVAATLGLAERLKDSGAEVVLTGVVESAAGLWATAQVAAAVGSPLPHGLATSDWLAEDLGEPPVPRDGRIHLPDAPGSGFIPLGRGTG